MLKPIVPILLLSLSLLSCAGGRKTIKIDKSEYERLVYQSYQPRTDTVTQWRDTTIFIPVHSVDTFLKVVTDTNIREVYKDRFHIQYQRRDSLIYIRVETLPDSVKAKLYSTNINTKFLEPPKPENVKVHNYESVLIAALSLIILGVLALFFVYLSRRKKKAE